MHTSLHTSPTSSADLIFTQSVSCCYPCSGEEARDLEVFDSKPRQRRVLQLWSVYSRGEQPQSTILVWGSYPQSRAQGGTDSWALGCHGWIPPANISPHFQVPRGEKEQEKVRVSASGGRKDSLWVKEGDIKGNQM